MEESGLEVSNTCLCNCHFVYFQKKLYHLNLKIFFDNISDVLLLKVLYISLAKILNLNNLLSPLTFYLTVCKN